MDLEELVPGAGATIFLEDVLHRVAGDGLDAELA
jgi:hypothetical protein